MVSHHVENDYLYNYHIGSLSYNLLPVTWSNQARTSCDVINKSMEILLFTRMKISTEFRFLESFDCFFT